MKEYIIKNYIIKKNKEDIFNIAYNNNDFTSSMLNISNYIKGEWTINKKILTRIDTFDVAMDNEIPDILSANFLNNSKDLKIKIKNTILEDNNKIKKIKTKTYFTNLKYKMMDKINNLLKIINIKNIVVIEKIDDTASLYSSHITVKATLPSPFKDIIETLSINFCTKLTNELVEKLQN
jgi:hypothetical protein